MSQESLREYILRVRHRYQRLSGKLTCSRLLDECCEVSGLERKYASKVLSEARRDGQRPGRGGAPKRYGQAETAAPSPAEATGRITPVPLEPGEPLSVCIQAIAVQSDSAWMASIVSLKPSHPPLASSLR